VVPYIKEQGKPELEALIRQFNFPLSESDLDYVISRLAIETVKKMEPRFVSLNKIWGVMSGAAKEFWDRVVRPYENLKAKENGDVFADVLPLFGLHDEVIELEGD